MPLTAGRPGGAAVRTPGLAPAAEEVDAPRVWDRPDPALTAAGVEGEWVVARVRVAAMALLLISPTWNLLTDPAEPIHRTGFVVTLTAAVIAVVVWHLIRSGRWRPWIGFASSALDVTMVSTALLTFFVVSSPLVALNSTVTFEMYFLAITATSLRYDARICVLAGALAIAQYAGLWAAAAARVDLRDPAFVAAAGPYLPVDLATRLILLAIATLLAVTIVRRAQRLLHLAARDRLTGLFNRGHFDRALENALDAAGRSGEPLSLAILDIDRFKQVNDAHGHAAGDETIRLVARRLANATRRSDVVARYGGEEFVVLMPGMAPGDALLRMEAIRAEVAAHPIDLGGGVRLEVNFSAGVAGQPDDRDVGTADAILMRADERLLAAKRGGRGRCVGVTDAG